MTMNKKLKSKVTSFLALGTNPQDYSVRLHVCTKISHCQLCGSALDYSFPLIHASSTPEDNSKDLYVGCDCVENFMEAHFPVKKEEVKRKMKELVEKTKSSLFLEENPTIKQIAKDIRNYFWTTLRAEAYKEQLMSEYHSLLRSYFLAEITKDMNSIHRKSYLSKPKTEKILKLNELIKTNKFVEILKENAETRKKTIADLMDVDKSFYDVYLSRYVIAKESVAKRVALNVFEKQKFFKDNKIKNNFEIIEGIY